MPPVDAIRRALINMLKAKGHNIGAQEGVGTISPQGKFVPPDPAQAAGDLRQARQQAQQVQGADPLAVKAANVDEPRQKVYQLQQFEDDAYGQVGMALKNQKGFTPEDAIARGTGSEVTTRHADPFGGPDYAQKTVLDDIEGAAPNVAYPKLIEEFQQLVGRSPTPDEINNRPLMERIIDSIKGPNKAAIDDDIPF